MNQNRQKYLNEKVDLVWMLNGVVKEVIERNKTRSQLAFLKTKLKNSTHKTGALVYLVNGTHKY